MRVWLCKLHVSPTTTNTSLFFTLTGLIRTINMGYVEAFLLFLQRRAPLEKKNTSQEWKWKSHREIAHELHTKSIQVWSNNMIWYGMKILQIPFLQCHLLSPRTHTIFFQLFPTTAANVIPFRCTFGLDATHTQPYSIFSSWEGIPQGLYEIPWMDLGFVCR